VRSRWILPCPNITFLTAGGRHLIHPFYESRLDTREAGPWSEKSQWGEAEELRKCHLSPAGLPEGPLLSRQV
jgi:hypothetical protein